MGWVVRHLGDYMPLYEYICGYHHRFELLESVDAEVAKDCPVCRQERKDGVRKRQGVGLRIFSSFSIGVREAVS